MGSGGGEWGWGVVGSSGGVVGVGSSGGEWGWEWGVVGVGSGGGGE